MTPVLRHMPHPATWALALVLAGPALAQGNQWAPGGAAVPAQPAPQASPWQSSAGAPPVAAYAPLDLEQKLDAATASGAAAPAATAPVSPSAPAAPYGGAAGSAPPAQVPTYAPLEAPATQAAPAPRVPGRSLQVPQAPQAAPQAAMPAQPGVASGVVPGVPLQGLPAYGYGTTYALPGYGLPGYGLPGYGVAAVPGLAPYGLPYGSSVYGAAPYGGAPYGLAPYGLAAPRVDPYGPAPYGYGAGLPYSGREIPGASVFPFGGTGPGVLAPGLGTWNSPWGYAPGTTSIFGGYPYGW